MLAYLLAVVVDVTTVDPTPVLTTPPPHNYLHPPGSACDSRSTQPKPSDEIVVCGDKDRDRLKPIEDDRFEDKQVLAETKFFGGKLKAHVDDGLFGSKRAMITLTIPF